MLSIKRICAITLLSLVAVSSVLAANRSTKKHKFIRFSDCYVGFYKGCEVLYPRRIENADKFIQIPEQEISLKIPVSNHVKFETGICFTSAPGCAPIILMAARSEESFSVPIVLDYYLLQRKSKLQPYFGAGVMVGTEPRRLFLQQLDDKEQYNTAYPGTKFISILFTQGMTFEVNTKIQLNETIHFLSTQSSPNTFSIGFGVGFRLP